jgi:hypothetical protein
MSTESLRAEIYVRPFPEGSGKWRVSQNGGGHPHWSADGTQLFFRDNAGIQVAGVEIDGPVFRHDQPRPLFNGSYMGGYHGLQEGTEGSRGDYAARPGRRIVRPVPGRRQRGGW